MTEATHESDIGIYVIKNIINGHRYIGSSCEIQQRWCKHRWELNAARHCSIHLQRAWTKYGEGKFRFLIIHPFVLKDELFKTEQWYLDNWNPEYNINPIAGSPTAISTPVVAYYPSSKIPVLSYNYMREAKKDGYHAQMISDACRGYVNTYKGLIWEYNCPEEQIPQRPNIGKPIIGIDIATGKELKYDRIKYAGLDGYNMGTIVSVCKGRRKMHKGVIWSYA